MKIEYRLSFSYLTLWEKFSEEWGVVIILVSLFDYKWVFFYSICHIDS